MQDNHTSNDRRINKTIDSLSLSTIRDACRSTGDQVIYEYYDKFKNIRSREEPSSEDIYYGYGVLARGETFQTKTYAQESALGVIDVDLAYPDASADYLSDAYDFLLDSNNTHGVPYLSILGDVIPYLTQIPDANGNPSAARKGLDM